MKIISLGLLLLLGHVCFSQTPPSVQFSFVPGWGKNSLLQGRVHNTTISDHGIAVYIFVEEAGGWWNKPYTASPVTMILPDSTFSTQIVIGGVDEYATKIIAFLIPLSYSPPLLSGDEIPGELFTYPYVVQCRPHGERVISWSGLEWTVKRSVGSTPLPIGPGPNIFNDHDSMVWVDDQQKLHLRIAKTGERWHCTELICNTSKGYSRYTFDVASRVDLLDPNIIAGIFTWDDCSPLAIPPNNYFREIDFEFSRWGNPWNENSQFVVQPYNISGNMNRFNMNLTGFDHSVHFFDWSADSIIFKSVWGDSFYTWSYMNTNYIPTPGNEQVRMNFHLLNGAPPSDHMPAEFVLNSFITGIGEADHGGKQARVFPNPMLQGCLIDIQSTVAMDVEVGVVDLKGNYLKKVFRGKLSAGSNRVEWDGKIEHGKPLQPGFYFIFIKDMVETRYFKIIKI
jgi:hypothetical protein